MPTKKEIEAKKLAEGHQREELEKAERDRKAAAKIAAMEERQKQEDKTRLARPERRAVLNKFLDQFETWSVEFALNACNDLGTTALSFTDGKDLPEWVETLSPWEQAIDKEVRKVLETADEVAERPYCYQDEYSAARYYQEQCAYFLGVLVGLKAAGYSRSKLERAADAVADVTR